MHCNVGNHMYAFKINYLLHTHALNSKSPHKHEWRMIWVILGNTSCTSPKVLYILVHKRMFYIRTNLRMLQHSNVECNIRMLIPCNKMMYFDDFVVLVACISSEFIFIT